MILDITKPEVAERQHRMMGCGLDSRQIALIMSMTDERIREEIAKGKDLIERLDAGKAEIAKKLVAALEAEQVIRAEEWINSWKK